MRLVFAAISALVLQAQVAWAQDFTEKVWSVVAFTLYGDTTPTALSEPRRLTPLGAQDLYTAGSVFRNRYVTLLSNGNQSSTGVQGISPYLLSADQVNIYSTSDQFVAGSAQAFMQGLYPPLNISYNGSYLDSASTLANGSVASYPLNGYQYADIFTAGWTDPYSTAVAGQTACFTHQMSEWAYQNSPEFFQIKDETSGFYAYIYELALTGVYDADNANYANAYDISEYLEYAYLHNSTLQDILTQDDLSYARALADQYVYATNGNVTGYGQQRNDDRVTTIAGRTMVQLVVDSFNSSIEAQGSEAKMSLIFGSYEPAVAFAALAQMPDLNSNFYGRPVPGASLVFELFSYENESNVEYPSDSDMYVRFLLRNSTDASEGFTYYPLFGYSPSQIPVPYTEFAAEIAQFAVSSTADWCEICSSNSIFCSGAVPSGQGERAGSKKGLSLAGAGAIGACVALVTAALVAAVLLLCGFRIHRKQKPAVGGFKGNKKLASDTDVTFKSSFGGAIKTSEAQTEEPNPTGTTRGHERQGSWELGQQKKETESDNAPKTTPDFDQHEEEVDPFQDPVKPHESV
ncbi:hypothetical protein Plec18167_005893 [Paecilomyces lecythidis]|uniref:Histidine acid phosphatase n=1 Tax=Paecilomyces lecythidis TaxID=3004212 RepID=A0ABR3XFX8_9EURO